MTFKLTITDHGSEGRVSFHGSFTKEAMSLLLLDPLDRALLQKSRPTDKASDHLLVL